MDTPDESKAPENSPKLAQKTAALIERDIIRLGWPVGRNLGSEAELVERYRVGRWVMREAINIAASDGLLEIRRGRNGGLFVAAPAESAVITILQNYLELSQTRIEDLIAARSVIESLAVRLAAQRIDLDRADELRRRAPEATAAIDEGSALREIFVSTGNLALYVFACTLANTLQSVLRRCRFEDRNGRYAQAFAELRRAQIEAIVAADIDACIALQRQCDALWQELATTLHAKPARRGRDKTVAAASAKASDTLVWQLLDEIAANRWRTNHNLGSEQELLTRYGVSRETLREAIRRLERHGIVEMRLGRGDSGGLRIAAADPTATVKSAALYLKYIELPLDAVYELQVALDLAAVSNLVRQPETQRRTASAELARMASLTPATTVAAFETWLHDYYLRLGDRCGNPVFALFIHILTALITIDRGTNARGTNARSDRRSDISQETLSATQNTAQRLATAVAAADTVAARRCFLELRRIGMALQPHERSAEDIVARDLRPR